MGFVFVDESSGVARAALGIFFQPVINGSVRFGAHPTLIGGWGAAEINAHVKSRGAAGLKVYRFKLDGTIDPPPSNDPNLAHDYLAFTDTELWYYDSNEGSGGAEFSPWLTIEFDVAKNRFYNLWVFARVNAMSDGCDLFWAKMKWKFVT